ncbi:hypothetical protein M9H77_01293 [Catharanthus roseus]|uniref:Uncharacterized protein n=1 Tax=Catharanthus roseus TaxID=4058 RepID=A0ACC0C5K0_CATRO|nr:hypothetical protein M9H77_01293 [Catharanthus roseus]
MSATTMNHSRRQILTPGPSNNKRKERDGLDGFKSSAAVTTKSLAKPSIHRAPPAQQQVKAPQPTYNNQLLAGYLAHEYLSKGTLFGEPFDPARAEAIPLSSSRGGVGKPIPEKRKAEPTTTTTRIGKAEKQAEKHQKYLEVAELLKADGAHLPGIVNPTQLARFLHIG